MTEDEKPTLEELMHYGVLGMKWGKTRIKADTGQIRGAQRNFEKKRTAYWDQQNAAKKFAKGSKERAKADQKTADMKLALLKDPDRAVAARLTRGEKAAFAALSAVALTNPVTAPVGVGGLANIALGSGISRRIERKQELGKYDKK